MFDSYKLRNDLLDFLNGPGIILSRAMQKISQALPINVHDLSPIGDDA
jgi:hypothetical protein